MPPASTFSKLTLILTYQCCLRCRYCPVEKGEAAMPFETARRAVAFFASENLKQIRFAGGDPLTQFGTIRRLLRETPGDVRFCVTTNGVGLTLEIIDELESDPRVDLVLSVDGGRATHTDQRRPALDEMDSYAWFEQLHTRLARFSRPVTVNMVISPRHVTKLVENVVELLRKGFFRINFLPAYYVVWLQDEIASLNEQLRRLSAFIAGGWRRQWPIQVVNLERTGELPLFSGGWVVDVDGNIFDSDIITTRFFSQVKNDLTIGNISLFSEFSELEAQPRPRWPERIAERLPKGVLNSTNSVDQALTAFVQFLQGEQKI